MYATHFIVKGTGTFPTDMLRYDACFPATRSDVEAIDHVEDNPREVELIRYHRYRDHNICEGRWHSMGWDFQKVLYTRKVQ